MPQVLAVTLYRSRECGLCDRAAAMLARLARELPLAIDEVDIASDPALETRFFLDVPVVAVGDVVVAKAPIAEASLRAELAARVANEGSGWRHRPPPAEKGPG